MTKASLLRGIYVLLKENRGNYSRETVGIEIGGATVEKLWKIGGAMVQKL
jgi:hypothetical protein